MTVTKSGHINKHSHSCSAIVTRLGYIRVTRLLLVFLGSQLNFEGPNLSNFLRNVWIGRFNFVISNIYILVFVATLISQSPG